MNEKIKIIADCDIPYLRGVLEEYADIQYIKGKKINPEHISDAQVLIIRTRTMCNKALLEGSRVKHIFTATIGFDHIDLDYCRNAKIQVHSAAGCNARGVLQWVAATLVHDAKIHAWLPCERTLGVVGVGNVGSLIAHYAKLWGFKVLCCDPYKDNADFVTINTIYKHCDIITFHVPCTKLGEYPTYKMLDKAACDRILPKSLILNASRGEIVTTVTLKENSKNLHFAFDTWEAEPDLDLEFLLKCCISTPHIAGYSIQGKANGTSMVVRQLAEIYNLPLTNWYPNEIKQTKIRDISWPELCQKIEAYYDIAKESEQLKANPESFEQMRNNYTLREEFF